MQAYNQGWSLERDFHVLKDRPLGIQPLYVREEEQIEGMTRLLMIGLRVLSREWAALLEGNAWTA